MLLKHLVAIDIAFSWRYVADNKELHKGFQACTGDIHQQTVQKHVLVFACVCRFLGKNVKGRHHTSVKMEPLKFFPLHGTTKVYSRSLYLVLVWLLS